jgi:hypothetical protein
MMVPARPRGVVVLFFPTDPARVGAGPSREQLDAMTVPWSPPELREAGEAALMGLFERGEKKTVRAWMPQLAELAWLTAVVGRHREDFYERRNEGPLSDLQVMILNGDHARAAQLLRGGAPESPALPSMHVASFEGSADMVDALVAAGAEVGALNARGKSAAWIAAAGNHEALEALLHHGADPRTPDTDGVTPLMVAIANMSAPCAELLLPVSDLRAKDSQGRSACERAPSFHADPDDPDFERMVRYARLLRSLHEAAEFDSAAGPGLGRGSRSL